MLLARKRLGRHALAVCGEGRSRLPVLLTDGESGVHLLVSDTVGSNPYGCLYGLDGEAAFLALREDTGEARVARLQAKAGRGRRVVLMEFGAIGFKDVGDPA